MLTPNSKSEFEFSQCSPIVVIPAGIPQELKEVMPCWAPFEYEIKTDPKTGKPKRVKVPHRVTPSGRYKRNSSKYEDRRWWSTFERAYAIYSKNDQKFAHVPQQDGIGFFTNKDLPYTVIDLDNAVDSETGLLRPWAQSIASRFNTYAEISPSGTGIKLFCRGRKPVDNSRAHDLVFEDGSIYELEIYDQKQYVTVTGNGYPGCPSTISDCQVELDNICMEIWSPEKRRMRDENRESVVAPVSGSASKTREYYSSGRIQIDASEIRERMLASQSGDSIRELEENGRPGSEGDLALCSHYAFWYAGDESEILDQLKRTARSRPKWDEPRDGSTWILGRIRKAISRQSTFYGDGNHHSTTDREFATLHALAADIPITFTTSISKCPRCKEHGERGTPCLCDGRRQRAAERRARFSRQAASTAATTGPRMAKAVESTLQSLENEFANLGDFLVPDATDLSTIEAAPANFAPPSYRLKFDCGIHIYLRSLTDARDRIVRARCRCWHCFQCNQQNKRDRCACFQIRLTSSTATTFYCATVPFHDWKRVYERIREFRKRTGGEEPSNYLRVEQLGAGDDGGDVYRVVCEAPVFAGFPSDSISTLDAKAASKFGCDAINSIGIDTYDREPISTSHAWNFSRPEPINKYERLGIVPRMDFNRIREILAEGDIHQTKSIKPRPTQPGEETRVISSLEITIPAGRNHLDLSHQIISSLRADMWMRNEEEWEGIEFVIGSGHSRERDHAHWEHPDLVNA